MVSVLILFMVNKQWHYGICSVCLHLRLNLNNFFLLLKPLIIYPLKAQAEGCAFFPPWAYTHFHYFPCDRKYFYNQESDNRKSLLLQQPEVVTILSVGVFVMAPLFWFQDLSVDSCCCFAAPTLCVSQRLITDMIWKVWQYFTWLPDNHHACFLQQHLPSTVCCTQQKLKTSPAVFSFFFFFFTSCRRNKQCEKMQRDCWGWSLSSQPPERLPVT